MIKTTWWTIVALLLVSGVTYADDATPFTATIEKIRRNEKIVIVNAGTQQGLTVGSPVCFYTGSNISITCGEVIRTLTLYSYVGVADEKISSLVVGMKAAPPPAAQPAAVDSDSVTPPPKEPQAVVTAPSSMNIKGYYLFTPVAVTTYSKLAYINAGEWGSIGTGRTAPVGFGLEYETTQTPWFDMAGGIKAAFQTEIRNIASDGSGVTSTNASAFGGYADAYLWQWASENLKVKLGAGLDVNYSTVKVNAKKADVVVATGRSNLLVTSGRLVSILDLPGEGIGFTVGGAILLPFVESARTGSASDPEFFGALQHKKAAIGVELLVSAYYPF